MLPKGVRSAVILRADEPVTLAPSDNAGRRGTIALNVRLPIFGTLRGPGCAARWLSIGPSAWLCEDHVQLSTESAIDPRFRTFREAEDGLPFRYFFVGPDGSFGYREVERADVGDPDMQLDPGFAVAVVSEREVGGARYGFTNRALWVPMRDLSPVRAFAFRGRDVPEGAREIPFAWVAADKAKIVAKPGGAPVGSRARFEIVPFVEESHGPKRFTKIGDDAWIASNDVRHPTLAAPPPEVDVGVGERWIDVEIATQTLVAYEGARPVFATLVSTGKGRPGSPTATPPGTYRIWIKLLSSVMDNLEDENAARYYRIEDVPWVQYFSKGVGLHGAFWHRSFGDVRSHGCVNLSPLDAQRLFWWTSPHLPAGWTAVVPTAHELGTVVRVR